MIENLLIANRSEIVCRTIRTARIMGIRTVAVNSDAHTKALDWQQSSGAEHSGPARARAGYLVCAKIIAAAKATGAAAPRIGVNRI